MQTFAIALLSLLLSVSAGAQAEDAPPEFRVAAGTPWSQPFFTSLDISFAGGDFHARWEISRCTCGDLHIRAEETLPQEIRRGEQLLLDGTALLVRGYESHEGSLSSLLDSPILMMQLLFVLLQKAEPSGPPAVAAPLAPEISEPSIPIELDSGTAFGLFPAPWSLSGTIAPGPDGRFEYALKFEFSLILAGQAASREQILLSGFVDYKERPFPVADSGLLDGWSLEWLQKDGEDRPGLEAGMTLGQFRAALRTAQPVL